MENMTQEQSATQYKIFFENFTKKLDIFYIMFEVSKHPLPVIFPSAFLCGVMLSHMHMLCLTEKLCMFMLIIFSCQALDFFLLKRSFVLC